MLAETVHSVVDTFNQVRTSIVSLGKRCKQMVIHAGDTTCRIAALNLPMH